MSISFVGPLPPPVHGFSNINMLMLNNLKNYSSVNIYDRSPSQASIFKAPQTAIKLIFLVIKFFLSTASRKTNSLYIGISGGKGQVIDYFFIKIASFFKLKIFIHHHSFAYINSHSKISAACFSQSNNIYHIALCDKMRDKLSELYDIDINKIYLLSNSAYMKESNHLLSGQRIPHKIPKIGFISNITEEKGIFEFFDCIESLSDEINCEAVIAGPVSEEIKEQFLFRLGESNAKYIGPVYGAEKNNFFASLDFLLFPTKYKNEAEPVTIIEAMEYGVYTIAANRGCIAGLIPNGCGVTISIENYTLEANKIITSFCSGEKNIDRSNIIREYNNKVFKNISQLNKISMHIAG
jgi:glycosyltransferase involved in cell wall biosynthesis